MKLTLPQDAKIVQILAPATDAAGRNGAAVSLKNYGRATIICHITQGNAATIALTLQQCTAVAGTSAKALTVNVPIWANLDTSTDDNLARVSDGVAYTTDAAVKNKIVAFQVDPSTLDLANGFDCLRITTGASNVANITQAIAILHDPRYAQTTPPSAVVD
jgi:hypothetical protein